MTTKNLKEYYDQCMYFMEDGLMDELESMDWKEIYKVANKESETTASPIAHYMMANCFISIDDMHSAMQEKLKAAALGHCVSAIDYLGQFGTDSDEILGIAKSMNDAGEKLASLQEDVDYAIKNLSPERLSNVNQIANDMTKRMSEHGIKPIW